MLEVALFRSQAVHSEADVVDRPSGCDIDDVENIADASADVSHDDADLPLEAAGSVMRRCKGGDRVHPSLVSAPEEFGQVVGVGRGTLFGTAVDHELGQKTAGHAAERVADDIRFDEFPVFVEGAPLREQGSVIRCAKTVHAILLGVGLAVVDRAAEELCVHFTGAVPGRGEGPHGRGGTRDAHFVEHLPNVFDPQTKIGDLVRGDLLLAIAEHPVQQDHRVPVLLRHSVSSFNSTNIKIPNPIIGMGLHVCNPALRFVSDFFYIVTVNYTINMC